MEMKLINNLKPPQAAAILLLASVVLHVLLPREYRSTFAWPASGAVALELGFSLMIWGWWFFRQNGTPIRPTDQAVCLVTAGPYRFTRNPMYLGILIMLVGIAIWVGSLPMLIAPVGFVLLMSWVFIPYEEQRLGEAFGEAYREYSTKVRRWL